MSSPNDLEELFSRQPPYSPDELRRVIAHFREVRTQFIAGVKPKKEKPQGKVLSMEELGLAAPKADIEDITL
jgi:hypothetical protein